MALMPGRLRMESGQASHVGGEVADKNQKGLKGKSPVNFFTELL